MSAPVMRAVRWLAAALITAAAAAFATTWAEEELACPWCGAESTYNVVMSFGSYIYDWPSKFELIYWPATENEAVYACPKCGYGALMWDFGIAVPEDKRAGVEAVLAGVLYARKYEKYMEIPLTDRLTVAEKVYGVLDRDDDFWCRFYRIKGYHLAARGDAAGAAAARRDALARAEAILASDKYADIGKETYLIAGAMRYLTGDAAAAEADFNAALTASYNPAGLDDEGRKNATTYLDGLAREYLAKVRAGE